MKHDEDNLSPRVAAIVEAMPRRHFLKAVTAGAVALPLSRLAYSLGWANGPHRPAAQGNSASRWEPPPLQRYEQGPPTIYAKSRDELKYIGMPVGGIGCGTLYLGGDGRLWLWDIFNTRENYLVDHVAKDFDWAGHASKRMDVPSKDGANYVAPLNIDDGGRDRDLLQGFMLRVAVGERVFVRRLEAADWAEVEFQPTYPIGKLRYTDPDVPVVVTMEAFSPFIPTNEKDSGLPATVLSFEVENLGDRAVEVSLLGWLENKVSVLAARKQALERNNVFFRSGSLRGFVGSMRKTAGDDQDEWTRACDHGTLCLASRDPHAIVYPQLPHPLDHGLFARLDSSPPPRSEATARTLVAEGSTSPAPAEPFVAGVRCSRRLGPKGCASIDFVLGWHFAQLQPSQFGQGYLPSGRYYGTLFRDAQDVLRHVDEHYSRLTGTTRAWTRLWYEESTLPRWFAERTLWNASTLATGTVWRLSDGRMYGFESAGQPRWPGTCTHVWQYAQAPARLFPALERDVRERVDLGVAMNGDGGIGFRGEADREPAIDGQAGTILRIYREHQMSPDDAFLRRNWPNIRRAIEFLLRQDTDGDGLVDTSLENTLDAKWGGQIAWIAGLAIAAVEAGRRMAEEAGAMDARYRDDRFVDHCKAFVGRGSRAMVDKLFNEELGYFIHAPARPTSKRDGELGTYDSSHIDQVYGQAWAHQVGLGALWDRGKTLRALQALVSRNLTDDVTPFTAYVPAPRPYALPGEAGTIMTVAPPGDPNPFGSTTAWNLGYFHECMSGFEHQLAAHLMAEGQVEHAFKVIGAIHARYHAKKRNPFNEVECGDHYARAMASYGSFISACGFRYHGPRGHLRFAPRFNQADFRCAFTSASGWGSYGQQCLSGESQRHRIRMLYGTLGLAQLALPIVASAARGGTATATIEMAGIRRTTRRVPISDEGDVLIVLESPLTLEEGDELTVELHYAAL